MMNLRQFSVKRGCPVPLAALFCLFLSSVCKMPEGDGSSLAGGRGAPFDPDLYSWKTASWTPFTVADSIAAFAYGNPGGKDRYVAVAKNGVTAWSDDGDIWHKAEKLVPDGIPSAVVPDPFEKGFNAVTWGSGKFVAAGNAGRVAWSDDGVKWTAVGFNGGIKGFGAANSIMGIAYGNGIFVAVGGNASIARSADGIEWWNCKGDYPGSSHQLNDIVYSNSEKFFYIAGDGGNTGWSNDPQGGKWNHYQYLHGTGAKSDSGYPFFGNNIKKISAGLYGGAPAIAAIFDEWGGRRIAISKTENYRKHDAHDWDADIDAGNFGNNAVNGIAWGGGYFAAAGQAALIGWWPGAQPSNNSQRYWRALSFTEFFWWEISSLAACKDRFFIGNLGGKIGYSK